MKHNSYKIVYTRHKILFPHGTIQIHAYHNKKILKKSETVLAYPTRFLASSLLPRQAIVTVSRVIKEINSAGIPMVEIKGLGRARLTRRYSMHLGTYEHVEYKPVVDEELLADKIRKKAQEFVFLIDIPESDRLIYLMTFITQLNELIDFISHYFITHPGKKWKLYRELDLRTKSKLLINTLDSLIHDVRRRREGNQ